MKKSLGRMGVLLICISSISFICSVRGATIYDDSVNDLQVRFNPGTLEVGDEIGLAGTERYLTRFDFEYWGTNTASTGNLSFAGSVQARVRFYLNDGTAFNGFPTPGTGASMFYDSGWFGGFSPTARQTLVFTAGSDFPAGGLFIPSNLTTSNHITWSIQFQGMTATDSVGVDIYSPAVVGTDYSDYWLNSGGSWSLQTNNAGPIDFASRFFANQEVPEPTSLALCILGGMGMLVSWGRSRSRG